MGSVLYVCMEWLSSIHRICTSVQVPSSERTKVRALVRGLKVMLCKLG